MWLGHCCMYMSIDGYVTVYSYIKSCEEITLGHIEKTF